MGIFDDREGALGTGLLLATGLALLAVPIWDIWADVMIPPHKSPISTLIENSFPILLALLLLGSSGWLIRDGDWRGDELFRAGRWTAFATVGATLLMAWIIGIQLLIQNDLKPHIVAADAVMAAALAGLAVGIYDVQRRRHRRDLETERDRLSALYEHTTDAIVTLDRGIGETADVSDSVLSDGVGRSVSFEPVSTNSTYSRLLDRKPAAVIDAARSEDDEHITRETIARHLREGTSFEKDIRLPVDNGDRDVRDFKLRVVPTDTSYAYLVFTDITDQKERERFLEERGEQLEREKSAREEELEERTNQLQFLHSLLRHDVQNGMMVISSRAEFIAERVDDRLSEYAETIVSRSSDISEQIDRMRTTLETLTSEKWPTQPIAVDDVIEDRVESASRSHPTASFAIDGELPAVDVEADEMLTDVVDNLLHNGVEHNDAGTPEIRVGVTEHGDSVRITVADNGPGIPEERRDEVFRRGVTSANEGGDSGSGFGLFFVDTMVDAYDGDVRVEESDAGGARFVLDLPTAEKRDSDTDGE